jgi:Na+/alanine symporter
MVLLVVLINYYLWKYLWILLLVVSCWGYHRFKQLKIIHQLDAQEKKNNSQLFFVNMAGSIGLGNIFVVINGVNNHGPSVIVWMWLGAIVGRFLKFWELYLSLTAQKKPGDFTGPIVYISQLNGFLGGLFIGFSLVYYVEIFQFNALIQFTHSMVMDYSPWLAIKNFHYYLGFIIFVAVIFFQEKNRFMALSKNLMTIFLWGYLLMAIFLLIKYCCLLPAVVQDILLDTFNWRHGSTKILALMTGIKTAIYCNDIGVGYEGIMQTYARVEKKNYGAYCYNLINGNFIDLLVCTASGLMALFYYKIFHLPHGSMDAHQLLIRVFNLLIPHWGHLILWFFIFCAAFTTLCTLNQSGLLVVKHLSKKYTIDHRWFYIWSGLLLGLSMVFSGENLFDLITLSGGILVLINCLSIGYILWTHP